MGKAYAQIHSPIGTLPLSVDASVAAMGDYYVSSAERLPGMLWQNPAQVFYNRRPEPDFAVSYMQYYANVYAASATSNFSIRNVPLSLGIRHLSYGRFDGYDEAGRSTSSFSGAMQLFNLSYGRSLGSFGVAASLLPVYTVLSTYRSYSMFLDLGGIFVHPSQRFQMAVVVKGLPLVQDEDVSWDPVDVWLGATYQPMGTDFRLSCTVYGLTRRTYYYDSSSSVLLQRSSPTFLQDVLSKCNFSLEWLLHKVIVLRSGLNVARRQALRTDTISGWAGFSAGLSLKLAPFIFSIARTFHEVRTARTHFTLSTNFKT